MNLPRLIVYGTLSVGLIVALWMPTQGSQRTSASAPHKMPRAKPTSDAAWDRLPDLSASHFDKPDVPLRNIFKPLLYVDMTKTAGEAEQVMKIPAVMAEGDGGWAYTGMAEVNGVKMALLENSAKHEAGYVKEGEAWKKSRITKITQASITVQGPDGSEETVFRYNANLQPKPGPSPAPEPGFRPMDLGPNPLKGQIGPNVEITPSRTFTIGKQP